MFITCSDGNRPGRAGFVSKSGSDPNFKTFGLIYLVLTSESKIIGPTRPYCFTSLPVRTRPGASCCIIN
jgi:hypothetical protein